MLQQQQQQPDPPILFERRPIRTAPPFTIAQLTLNRPHRGNALTPAMTHLIHTALDTIDRDPYVRMLVVTGRGRYFCTGMDLHEVGASAAASVAAAEGPVIREEGRQDEVDDADNEVPSLAMFQAMFERLHRLAVPTLCLLNGPGIMGGGGVGIMW